MANSQKKRWRSLSSQELLILLFGVVTRDGDVMPPFILQHDLRLNTEANIRYWEEVVLAWIEKMTARLMFGNWTLRHAMRAGDPIF